MYRMRESKIYQMAGGLLCVVCSWFVRLHRGLHQRASNIGQRVREFFRLERDVLKERGSVKVKILLSEDGKFFKKRGICQRTAGELSGAGLSQDWEFAWTIKVWENGRFASLRVQEDQDPKIEIVKISFNNQSRNRQKVPAGRSNTSKSWGLGTQIDTFFWRIQEKFRNWTSCHL